MSDCKALARFLRACAFTAQNWYEAAQEERIRADELAKALADKESALTRIGDLLNEASRLADRAAAPELPDAAFIAAQVEAARNPRPAAGKRRAKP